MIKQDRIKKAVATAKKKGLHISRPIKGDSWLTLMMKQDINVKGKDVRIITFKDGSNGLLIDGVRHNMEIIFYTKRDTNKTVKQTGMEIVDYGKGEIDRI